MIFFNHYSWSVQKRNLVHKVFTFQFWSLSLFTSYFYCLIFCFVEFFLLIENFNYTLQTDTMMKKIQIFIFNFFIVKTLVILDLILRFFDDIENKK